MTILQRLAYDLRHPITFLERRVAERYCRRFELHMAEGPYVRLWSADFEHVATVVTADA